VWRSGSCGDPAQLLQPADQALNPIAFPIRGAVEGEIRAFVALGWNHGLDAASAQGGADHAATVRLVGGQPIWFET
jgi:hypothetical protein